MAFSGAGGGVEGEVKPPGAVVVPEVVVGVVFGAAVGDVLVGVHGCDFGLVFYKAPRCRLTRCGGDAHGSLVFMCS